MLAVFVGYDCYCFSGIDGYLFSNTVCCLMLLHKNHVDELKQTPHAPPRCHPHIIVVNFYTKVISWLLFQQCWHRRTIGSCRRIWWLAASTHQIIHLSCSRIFLLIVEHTPPNTAAPPHIHVDEDDCRHPNSSIVTVIYYRISSCAVLYFYTHHVVVA